MGSDRSGIPGEAGARDHTTSSRRSSRPYIRIWEETASEVEVLVGVVGHLGRGHAVVEAVVGRTDGMLCTSSGAGGRLPVWRAMGPRRGRSASDVVYKLRCKGPAIRVACDGAEVR